MVIVSNLYKDGEKFWSGKEHSHVTVQVSGVNSERNGMVNLGANFALSFFGLQVARCQESLLPEISGRIKEAGDFLGSAPPEARRRDRKSTRLNSSHT